MEKQYNELILYLENKFGHKFADFVVMRNNATECSLFKNARCIICKNVFTVDVGLFFKHWSPLNNFYYRFHRHAGTGEIEYTCEELIIKGIIE
jgi:hypothetical protein